MSCDFQLDPASYLAGREPTSCDPSCLALWQSVMIQAVKDLHDVMRFKRDSEGRNAAWIPVREHANLLRWFRSKQKDVGSFIWVCEVIDCDPDVVLKTLHDRYDFRTGEVKI